MRSVIVTRTDLGLEPLQLWQVGKFILPEGTFGAGQTQQRRSTTENNLVKGRYATAIVEGQRSANMGVHCMAYDIDDIQPLVEEVIAALTQFRFQLTWQWNGLGGVWACEAADWAVGEAGIINEGWLKVNNQPLYFVLPHRRVSGL